MRTSVLSAILICLTSFGLIGCARSHTEIYGDVMGYRSTNMLKHLQLGMSRQEVIERMGDPDDARTYRGDEYLYYNLREPLLTARGNKYFIKFSGNVVTSYGPVQKRREGKDLL